MYAELKQKICSKCGEEKTFDLFYLIAGGEKPRPECKSCTNAYHKKYRNTASGKEATIRARIKYRSSPDNITKDAQNKQEWARFKKYGITKSVYNQMLKDQNNKCAICDIEHIKVPRGLVVDHDHTSGKIRGLLCNHCNTGLGFFRDSVKIIKSAITYLKKFKK